MESTEKVQIGDTSRELFRSAASWMRAFAIIMIILVSILALVTLVLSADRGGSVIKALSASDSDDLVMFVKEMMGVIIMAFVIFVLIFGYASSRLLSAANAFTAISYNPDKDQLIKAFKNLKLYWQFYAITMMVLSVLFIYFMVKMISFISEIQP